jgi:hypothetical protein
MDSFGGIAQLAQLCSLQHARSHEEAVGSVALDLVRGGGELVASGVIADAGARDGRAAIFSFE